MTQALSSWLVGHFSMVLRGRYELVYLVVPLVVLAFIFANHFNIVGMGRDFSSNLGVNYNLDQVDALHARRPEQPMLLSECAATGTTRGWYRADCPQRGYINAFDRDTNKTFLAREKTWQFILARPWLAGGFQWAGI